MTIFKTTLLLGLFSFFFSGCSKKENLQTPEILKPKIIENCDSPQEENMVDFEEREFLKLWNQGEATKETPR